jgi:diamine N-acetyltransferase
MTNSETNIDQSAAVSLREITKETVRSILDLKVSEEQERFVASNARSIAEAYFAEEAWFRAIYADETPVGFVMVSEAPEKGEYFLWRFMIDARYQGKGYGRRALELVIQYVRTRPNAKELLTSHVKGNERAGHVYRKVGFEYTGEVWGIELAMKLEL